MGGKKLGERKIYRIVKKKGPWRPLKYLNLVHDVRVTLGELE